MFLYRLTNFAGVDPKEIPLPHEFLLNWARATLSEFCRWSAELMTFRGRLDGGLWLTDIAHHHLAIAILFLIAGHVYRTNWGIGHSLKEILEQKDRTRP